MIGDLGLTFPAGRARVGTLLWTLRRVPKPASLLFGKQTLPAVAGVAGDGVISRGPPSCVPSRLTSFKGLPSTGRAHSLGIPGPPGPCAAGVPRVPDGDGKHTLPALM